MKSALLAGTDIRTSELGFGCSSLLGPRTRAESLRLLEVAWDAGVRHFDVARYYGFGDAEGLVGEFLQAHREVATVTTKFGLRPAAGASRLKGVISVVRALMRQSTFIRNLVRRQVKNVVQGGRFSVDDARSSLETSLRELKRDHVDLFLLHECRIGDLTDELKAFLESQVQAGKIRAFGLGTEFGETLKLMRDFPDFAPMAQFESSALNRHVDLFREVSSKPFITHGSLNGLAFLGDYLETHPAVRAGWEKALDCSLADRETLATLLLAAARAANPEGVLLFRSTVAARVTANCSAISETKHSPTQLAELAKLLANVPRPS